MSNQVKFKNGVPENNASSALFATGVIMIIVGIVSGLILGIEKDVGSYTSEYSYSLPIIFTFSFSGIISGTCVIGLGEIIKQLLHLNLRMKNDGYTLPKPSDTEHSA